MRALQVSALLSFWLFQGCSEPALPPPDTAVHLSLTSGTAAPPEVTRLRVMIARVSVRSQDQAAWRQVLDDGPSGRAFDLLALQNGRDEELGAFHLPPGTYDQLHFWLGGNNEIAVDEGSGPALVPLKSPPADSAGMVDYPFTVTGDGPTRLVVAFDTDWSAAKAGNEWWFRLRAKAFQNDQMVMNVIGPAGGTVLLPNEARLDIPPGALASEAEISIRTAKIAPARAEEQGVMPSSLVALGPPGLRLAMPARVTLQYDQVEQRGRPTTELAFLSREAGRGWVRQPGTWDPQRGTCAAMLSQLATVAAGVDIKRVDPPAFGGVMDPGPPRQVEVQYWDSEGDPKSPLYGVETGWSSSDPSLQVALPPRDCAGRTESTCTRDAGCYFMGPECIDDRRIATVTPIRNPGGTITITPGHPSLTAATSATIRGLRVRFHDFYVQDDSDTFGAGALYWWITVNGERVVHQPEWQHHNTGDWVALFDQTSSLLRLGVGETFRLHAFFGEDDSWEFGGGGSDEAWLSRDLGWAHVGQLSTNTDTNNGEGSLDIHLTSYLERDPP